MVTSVRGAESSRDLSQGGSAPESGMSISLGPTWASSERRSCPERKKEVRNSPVEMSQKESPKPPSSPATHARKLLLFDSRFSESRTAPGVRTLTTFLSTRPLVCLGSPICSQTATFFPLARSFDMWGSTLWKGTPQRGTGFFLERSLEVRAMPSISDATFASS